MVFFFWFFFKAVVAFLEARLVLLGRTRSLIQTFSGSITPRLHIKHFFLPTGWTIRSLLNGPEPGGCEGSEKWARSHWIMPLFQLPWPGMPNFTARFSSVRQSKLREGTRRVRLRPRMIRGHHDPPQDPHGSILQLHPHKSFLKTTFLFKSHSRVSEGLWTKRTRQMCPHVSIFRWKSIT